VKAPTTPRQFRSGAERVFKRANPGLEGLVIEWIETVRVDRWHDGSAGFRGSFVASADGYTRRIMRATWCGGMMVR
jgi:hypothetical protein